MSAKIVIKEALPLFDIFRFAEKINWTIAEGEQWAVIGPNGAGKTLLTNILQGKVALREGSVGTGAGESVHGRVKSLEFKDIYSLVDCRSVYYMQRWSATEVDETPLAGDILAEFPGEKKEGYISFFGIGYLLDKHIISLSSGELRKLLIVRTLLSGPEVLILDNPFIGLDAASRESLSGMLKQMSRLSGIQVVTALSDTKDIPEWIDMVLPVLDKTLLPAMPFADFITDKSLQKRLFPEITQASAELPAPVSSPEGFGTVLKMDKVNVRYGNRTILRDLDWEVKNGEKWALLGENGSGKSTLLSLVTGDNPQAYANDIILFDRKRGTGETVWDIKGRIGTLNSDLHTYYLQDIPAIEVVVSGFYDSIGLFSKATEERYDQGREWLKTFGGGDLADRSFVKLSFGEQRLVLLARALVKDPQVLILDEPLHGFDAGKKELAREIIETFCARPGKTLIYVTHYTDEIPSSVTRIKRLKKTME